MAVKQIGVVVETAYLSEQAKLRKISRTRLTNLLVEKVIENDLIASILGPPQDLSTPPAPKYRRFPPKPQS